MYVAFTAQEAHFCDERDAAYIRGCGTHRVLILSSLSLVEGLLAAPDVPAATWTAAQRQLRLGGTAGLIEPRVPPGISRWLAGVGGCDRIAAQPDDDNPARYLARKRELCRQITAATGADWTRSLIVIGCFSIGLGTATRLERRWRPDDYAHHLIRRYDQIGLILAAIVVLLGALAFRLTGAVI